MVVEDTLSDFVAWCRLRIGLRARRLAPSEEPFVECNIEPGTGDREGIRELAIVIGKLQYRPGMTGPKAVW